MARREMEPDRGRGTRTHRGAGAGEAVMGGHGAAPGRAAAANRPVPWIRASLCLCRMSA